MDSTLAPHQKSHILLPLLPLHANYITILEHKSQQKVNLAVSKRPCFSLVFQTLCKSPQPHRADYLQI